MIKSRCGVAAFFVFLLSFGASAEEAIDPAFQQALSDWDNRQIMLKMAQRCPVMEPWQMWGLEAQIDNITKPGSVIYNAVMSQVPAGASINERKIFYDKQLKDREYSVDKMLEGMTCANPQMKTYLDQAPLFGRYGFYEEMYIFTRIEGGYCDSTSNHDKFDAALRADLSAIASEIPQTSNVKSQIDAASLEQLNSACEGTSFLYPKDLFTRYLQDAYEKEVLDRESGTPYQLTMPMIAEQTELEIYAWRARPDGTVSDAEKAMVVGSYCPNQLMVKTSEDGTFLSTEMNVVVQMGIAPSGIPIAEVASKTEVDIEALWLRGGGKSRLDPVNSAYVKGDLRANKIRGGMGNHIYRFEFDKAAFEEFGSQTGSFQISFNGKHQSAIKKYYESGCRYTLDELKNAYSWATEEGIGEIIK